MDAFLQAIQGFSNEIISLCHRELWKGKENICTCIVLLVIVYYINFTVINAHVCGDGFLLSYLRKGKKLS